MFAGIVCVSFCRRIFYLSGCDRLSGHVPVAKRRQRTASSGEEAMRLPRQQTRTSTITDECEKGVDQIL